MSILYLLQSSIIFQLDYCGFIILLIILSGLDEILILDLILN
jgi:hypothetical protein